MHNEIWSKSYRLAQGDIKQIIDWLKGMLGNPQGDIYDNIRNKASLLIGSLSLGPEIEGIEGDKENLKFTL